MNISLRAKVEKRKAKELDKFPVGLFVDGIPISPQKTAELDVFLNGEKLEMRYLRYANTRTGRVILLVAEPGHPNRLLIDYARNSPVMHQRRGKVTVRPCERE